jgi:hypothetical protein
MKWIVPLKTHFSAPNKQRKIDFGRWFSYVILFHQLSFWNQLRCALPPCGATGWKKLRDGCLPRCFQTRTGGLGGWASLEWWLVKGDYPKTVLISGWCTMKIYHDLSFFPFELLQVDSCLELAQAWRNFTSPRSSQVELPTRAQNPCVHAGRRTREQPLAAPLAQKSRMQTELLPPQ